MTTLSLEERRSAMPEAADPNDVHRGLIGNSLLLAPAGRYPDAGYGSLDSRGLEIGVSMYAPGGITDTHVHPDQEKAYYVLSGRVDLRIGDEHRELGQGAFAYIGPGVPHGFEALGGEPLELMLIFNDCALS